MATARALFGRSRRAIKEIAGERGVTLAAMIGAIDGDRKHANLSSAIRLFVLGVYRDQLASWGRH
jgi:predicted DNA-binding ribbon-helix-helix protein